MKYEMIMPNSSLKFLEVNNQNSLSFMNCNDEDNISYTNDDDSIMKKNVRRGGRKRVEKLILKDETLYKKKVNSLCKYLIY